MNRSHLANKRTLNTDELSVLEVVLKDNPLVQDLPLLRYTEADGPNQWGLIQWGIPSTLQSLGEVRVVDDETEDCIRFRRPNVGEEHAEVTLELPQEVVHCYLQMNLVRGWELKTNCSQKE